MYKIIITEGRGMAENQMERLIFKHFISEFEINLPNSVPFMYRMWLYVEGYL